MRSAKSQNFSPVTTRQVSQPRARSSVWTRMLVTGCIIGSLFAPTVLEAGGRKSKEKQDRPGVDQLARKSKEKVNCSKDSKQVTRFGVTSNLTVETCDNWKFIKKFFNDHELVVNQSINLKQFGGSFTNRQVNLGQDNCVSWTVTGESDMFFIILRSDFLGDDTGRVNGFIIDTEVPVKPNRTISVSQSDKSCEWTFSFSELGKNIGKIRFSESGKLIEESVKLTRAK